MSDLLSSLDVLSRLSGSAVQLVMNGALLLGAIVLNVWEYRRYWRGRPATWAITKLGVPLSAVFVIGGALLLAQGTEGFTGLLFFYVGIFVWLGLGPFIAAFTVGRMFGVPAKLAIGSGFSFIALIVVGWFGAAGIFNAVSQFSRTAGNYDELKAYHAFKRAAADPAAAGESVTQVVERLFLLPDGRRLLHVAFNVDPALELYRLEVRVRKPGSRREPVFSGTIGHCLLAGELHLTNVLDKAEWLEYRISWHRGSPESMVGVSGRFDPVKFERPPYLEVRVERERIDAAVPFPRHYVALRRLGDEGSNDYVDYARLAGGEPFGSGCLASPLSLPVPVNAARLTFYSEELNKPLGYIFAAQND